MGSVTGFVMAVLILSTTLTTIVASAKVDTNYGRKNRPNKHKKPGVSDTRTKVEAIHLDYPEGSGEDIFGGTDEDDSSGDDHLAILSECHRQQMAERERNVPSSYIPQCMQNGEFDSRQCHKARNICWCVDSSGKEIADTRKRVTEKMTCPKTPSLAQRVTQRTFKANQPTVRPTSSIQQRGDDVIIVDPKNKFSNGGQAESSVDITVVNPEGNEFDAKGIGSKHSTSSVFSKPGVLAVVIGGAVIGLLFSVTMVMFIVYRMRKKDEGSYALDEPKTSPTVGYTKTRDREFFA